VKLKDLVATANCRPLFAHSCTYILIPCTNKKKKLSRHGGFATGICAFLAVYICILIPSWNKKGTDVKVDELYKWYVLRALQYTLVCGSYLNAVWPASHSSVSLSAHFAYSVLLRTLTYVSEKRWNRSNVRSFHRRNDCCYRPPPAIVTQTRPENINCGPSQGENHLSV